MIFRIWMVIGILLLGSVVVQADGLVGQCSDCHTMHNSEQGQAVAERGLNGVISGEPIRNLLRMDCIACHAQGAGLRIAEMDGGSRVPQVYHDDPVGDLAAGNFAYIDGVKGEGSDRKGHNVVDLFGAGDATLNNEYGDPPGMHLGAYHTGKGVFTDDPASPYSKFTCAGSMGCHGTRAQLESGYVDETDPLNPVFVHNRRRGLAAVTGAHHNNFDGKKDPAQVAMEEHDGADVAASYRFIKGLKGTGNTVDRWQNNGKDSHNEYYGVAASPSESVSNTCLGCHVRGTMTGEGDLSRMTYDSSMMVPNQSMSGFCATCHGLFHSSSEDTWVDNGASGAFLRHPSDYVIPNRDEYAGYTEYSVTAPVARPTVYEAVDATVNPGTDMVMCLSCHMAHASPYNGMLRFDYAALTSGMRAGDGNSTNAGEGCLACHTVKGGAMPEGG